MASFITVYLLGTLNSKLHTTVFLMQNLKSNILKLDLNHCDMDGSAVVRTQNRRVRLYFATQGLLTLHATYLQSPKSTGAIAPVTPVLTTALHDIVRIASLNLFHA